MRSLFSIIILISTVWVHAQPGEWNIMIHTPAGYELYLEDMWWVDIMNNQEREREIYLFGEVFEEVKGDMFRGASNPIIIPPGGRQITPMDIHEIHDRWLNPEFESAILRHGRFPAGAYNICITVVDMEVGHEVGSGCVFFNVTMPGAPRLVTPFEDETIQEEYPMFQWTIPSPLPPEAEVYYYVKICRREEGQTVFEAIDNIAAFEIPYYRESSLQYPLEGLRLEEGSEYVWQIQALDLEGKPVGENDGKSEIWSFKYKQPSSVIPELRGPTPPDTLVMGDFELVVQEITSTTNNLLNGTAEGQLLTTPCTYTTSTQFDPFSNTISIPIEIYSQTNFSVDFKNLQTTNWPPDSKEKIVKGSITKLFNPPLRLENEGFEFKLYKLNLYPDSVIAEFDLGLPTKYLSPPSGCSPFYIGPIKAEIDEFLSFTKQLRGYTIDSLFIGNTGILFKAGGAKLDFNQKTKTIFFSPAQTVPRKTYNSNTGWTCGDYQLQNAVLKACWGFDADLKLTSAVQYETLIPIGFNMNLNIGEIKIEKSRIVSGTFSGQMELPESITDSLGNKIDVPLTNARIDTFLNFRAKTYFEENQSLCWRAFTFKTDSARLYLPAMAGVYSVAPLDTIEMKKYTSLPVLKIKSALDSLPGLTMKLFEPDEKDILRIKTPDMELPLHMPMAKYQMSGWLNISTKGMSGQLLSREEGKLANVELGVTTRSGYKSDSTFTATIEHKPDSLAWINIQLVRNAVACSYIGGHLTIPYPCDFTAKYKDLNLTSTAEMVGGDVFFKSKNLKYWGVKMTADSTGNVLSVDTGEIIYMNSWITEDVHFTKPFRIVWGEMLADGDLCKFIFDFNSAGQKFDGFPFTLHKAALSEYVPGKPVDNDTLGYLQAYGDVHFDFFGAKRMDILDYNDARNGHDIKPWKNRFVFIDLKNSQTHFTKKWGGGTADMDFYADYDIQDQNGFQGIKAKNPMLVDFQFLPAFKAGTLNPKTIDLNSGTSFIHFCCADKVSMDNQVLKVLGADYAHVNQISGLIQIKGDAIKRIVLEGQASIKSWKFQGQALANIDITPTTIILRNRGQISLTLYSAGMVGLASTKLVLNKSEGSLEGDINGVFQVYGGTNYAINQSQYAELEARGRFNFYFGTDSNYLQGYAKVKAKFGITLECEGAFFAGYNAPIKNIWALDQITRGPSIRSIIEKQKSEWTSEVTGIYIAGSFAYTVRLLEIIEGGFTVWAGVGVFGPSISKTGIDPSTTLLGHGGVEIHGEVLEGLLSASLFAELTSSMTIPLNPADLKFCIQGTAGLKVCALVFCWSWQGTLHADETGIGTGGCYSGN
ncbi:hypothetical protein JW935_22485 [candidate division KSB1 bacterium]|nr:hypothetical protein [candidate division KSB1 bacterium]